MKALVVYAHPSEASFNFALKEAVSQGLTETGWEVIESDLYKMNFNPILDTSDYPTYTGDSFGVMAAQFKAAEDKQYHAEVQAEMDKVTQSNLIVLQFPIWWFTCPAIMTGWLQRVFPIGFWYQTEHLKGKKFLISCTAGPSREIYDLEGHKEIEDILFHIKNNFVMYGFDTLPIQIIYNVNGKTAEERTHDIQALKDYIKTLNNA